MSHYASLIKSENGWKWPKATPCPSKLFSVVSSLDQTRIYISNCLNTIDDTTLWWRPQPGLPAIGNLLLHLAGTEHQWIGNRVGGLPLNRDRDLEFSAKDDYSLSQIVAILEHAHADTRGILEKMTDSSVNDDTLFSFHYTENHFAYHCGQIVLLRRLASPEFRVYNS